MTIKDGPDLGERFEHLRQSMRVMIDRARDCRKGRGRARGSFFADVLGGVGSFEFKRGGNSGEWHPHVHILAIAPYWPDAGLDGRQLSREWHELTGDSYIVDVRRIRANEVVEGSRRLGLSEVSDLDVKDGVSADLLEVFKYAVKFGENQARDQVDGWLVLAGRRLVFSFGRLWGVQVDGRLTEDPAEGAEKLEEGAWSWDEAFETYGGFSC